MPVTFLLGPAGSGKTHRCLGEIRAVLADSPEGPPLVLLAPKQATFQLERQLLADTRLSGYTRLHIVSFERLAEFVFDRLHRPVPPLLSEEGRVMVLRALLGRQRNELKLFHASARLPGFAKLLSGLLREFQRYHLSSERLEMLADRAGRSTPLGRKLSDFALLLRAYLGWLKSQRLQDADGLLGLATEAIGQCQNSPQRASLQLDGLWLDGFAQMTPQERHLLAALVPSARRVTLAFCLEDKPGERPPWHSLWSVVGQTFHECHRELSALPGCAVEVEVIPRQPAQSRFADNPVLRHVEAFWSQPEPFTEIVPEAASTNLRLISCPNPEAEATYVAREILRFVRCGGRFREAAVLVRHLEPYHDPLRRVFSRYQIPYFLDRREPVGHHPLAELTRCALRTVAFGWKQADWFGALKTGLVPVRQEQLDQLENEALARGWEGKAWLQPLKMAGDDAGAKRQDRIRQQVVPPFEQLAARLSATHFQPTGVQLTDALRTLWSELKVEQTLQSWTDANVSDDGDSAFSLPYSTLHSTVWQQMQEWLDNLARAFPDDVPPLPLRDWLPVLDAGLSGLTVGVIPPALDQVLLGAIDRSRNPDLQAVFVLGLNEGVFPAPPHVSSLLTEADRNALDGFGHPLGPGQRLQLGQERYYGYIACTRARQRVVLTYARHDADGKLLNPSSLVTHIRRLFPALKEKEFTAVPAWPESEHPCELVAPLLRSRLQTSTSIPSRPRAIGPEGVLPWDRLASWPVFQPVLERLGHFHSATPAETISPARAEQLYGPALETSVSRLEQFAACPFRFFVNSGLQAEERKKFEFEIREQGQFQHEVLAEFHQQLRQAGQRWRDLTPDQARERIGRIADELLPTFQNGLMLANEQNRFLARTYKESLQRFVATVIAWMAQYAFDPVAVEVGFGVKDGRLPAWELDLGDGHRLAFRGRIDRVDLWRGPGADEALCVVMDYKSSWRKIDPLLLEHGIQQQLPAYLNVLRRLKDPKPEFAVSRLIPAGVFYVNLRGQYGGGANRNEVLSAQTDAQKEAYRHEGLFDLAALRQLDQRSVSSGDQFNYRLRQSDGQPVKGRQAAMPSEQFATLLDRAEESLREMGRRIFRGEAQVDPYKKGQDTPCDQCDYKSICRIDPWAHRYRALKQDSEAGVEAEA